MKKLIFCLLLTSSLFIKAQNLVPNGSFEQADSCDPGQNIFVATGWKSYSGSPDYYSACADSSSGVSVPYNFLGYKPAADGWAYAGFYSYASDVSNSREYIGRQLSAPLMIGTSYLVSFKVNLVANSYNANQSGVDCANNGIGILFSTQPFKECAFPDSQSIVRPAPNRASVYSQTILSDTTNWTTISGYFTADSAYQYFEIGNLFADSLTDTTLFSLFNPYPWHIAYYLVDDIVVMDSLLTDIDAISEHNYFDVFPNPFISTATVKVRTKHSFGTLKMFDLFGNEVQQININSGETIISRENLSDGIYLLKLNVSNNTYTKKLIIN